MAQPVVLGLVPEGMAVLRAAEPNVEVTVAVTHRLHKYDGSHMGSQTETVISEMMQGKNKFRTGLRSSEHIVSTQYIDGNWWIFTEEIIMGPVP